ncbi:hypothetical protein [Streptomyces cyaneofuscatus]|uniref:hypothetical protein n=1 Tax=Streptomyces cyaneofuscatus TaxID=66883 RepID=UPI0037F48E0A
MGDTDSFVAVGDGDVGVGDGEDVGDDVVMDGVGVVGGMDGDGEVEGTDPVRDGEGGGTVLAVTDGDEVAEGVRQVIPGVGP